MHAEYKTSGTSAGVGGDDARMLLWEAARLLQRDFDVNGVEVARLMSITHSLGQMLEHTRVQYNTALAERDSVYRRLKSVDAQLQQVENIVRRYALVQDPVIASDGYTYERKAITDYLTECNQTNSKAYSQQTKEELSNVVVANLSLSRLVDLLKGIRTADVPPLKSHSAIAPLHTTTTTAAAVAGGVSGRGGGGGGFANLAPGVSTSNTVSSAAGLSSMEPSQVSGSTMGVVKPPHTTSATATAGGSTTSTMATAMRRYDHGPMRYGGGGGKAAAAATHMMGGVKPALHPCLRVYGCCNFMDDCTFANYPFDACLNFIKGKCRFGMNCKELHVDVREPTYQNMRSSALTNAHARYPQTTSFIAAATPAVVAATATTTTAAAKTTTAAATPAAAATTTTTAAATPPAATQQGDGGSSNSSSSHANNNDNNNNSQKSAVANEPRTHSGSLADTLVRAQASNVDTAPAADAAHKTTTPPADDAVATAATTTAAVIVDDSSSSSNTAVHASATATAAAADTATTTTTAATTAPASDAAHEGAEQAAAVAAAETAAAAAAQHDGHVDEDNSDEAATIAASAEATA